MECPEKQLCVNGHIWTKSKFMGTSIGVTFIGDITLTVGGIPRGSSEKGQKREESGGSEEDWVRVDGGGGDGGGVGVEGEPPTRPPRRRKETYVMSLPTAFARSIMTEPWTELGGRVSISCPESACTTPLVFHTKPFYGEGVHRVSGEVKSKAGMSLCKISGEWNSRITLTHPAGSPVPPPEQGEGVTVSVDAEGQTVEVVDVGALKVVARKRVRPVRSQGVGESRRLWGDVSTALQRDDLRTATAHKQHLEELQRRYEAQRKARGEPYVGKLFVSLPPDGAEETTARRGSGGEAGEGRTKDSETQALLGSCHWVYRRLPRYAVTTCR